MCVCVCVCGYKTARGICTVLSQRSSLEQGNGVESGLFGIDKIEGKCKMSQSSYYISYVFSSSMGVLE